MSRYPLKKIVILILPGVVSVKIICKEDSKHCCNYRLLVKLMLRVIMKLFTVFILYINKVVDKIMID